MPDSALPDDTVLTSTFYDTYIREQVVTTCTSVTRPTGVTGRLIYETDTDQLMVYRASDWEPVSQQGEWTTWTPALGSTGTQPTLGDSGGTVGRYRLQGLWCSFWARITFFGTGVTPGTGTYTVSLPFPADIVLQFADTGTANGESIGSGHARDASDAANSRTFGLWLRTATAVGMLSSDGGTINPAAPFVPASGDRYFIRGAYLIDPS